MISLRDKVIGCYLGAAIGDALGGPVQGMQVEQIEMLFGGIEDLLPYRKPPGFFDLGPGYALHAEPGSVTDETLIRAQIAAFTVEHPHSRNPGEFARHILRYGDANIWPPRLLDTLRRVERGQMTPEMASQAMRPGGGLGWWTSLGIVNAARPDRAASEVVRLAAFWKRPLEQDLLAAVQAGVAHALTPKATPESVVEAARSVVGPLARNLIDRAVKIARSVQRGDGPSFARQIYQGALVDRAPDTIDGEVPPPATPPYDLDKPALSPLLAEQVPLSLAAFAFGDGRSRLTLCAAASLGRGAKAIGSAVGSLVGALVGRSRLPREWVGAVIAVNQAEVDLVQQANELADLVEPKPAEE